MHSNDEKRKLEFLLGPSTFPNKDLKDILNNQEFFQTLKAQNIFYKIYKFHGYGDINSKELDLSKIPKKDNMTIIEQWIEDIGK